MARNKKTTKQRVHGYCSKCYVPTCDFRGPCKFPHGCCYPVMAILSALMGLYMNYLVVSTCIFQRVHDINFSTGEVIPGAERGYGFLSREQDYGLQPDYQQCVWYTQAEYDGRYDGWMASGRFFAFLSFVFASVGFFILCLTCCMAFSPSMFERWLMWIFIVAALTVAMTNLIFGSKFCTEHKCTVADGCGYAISAFMSHLVSANSVKSFAAANAPSNNNRSIEDYEDDVDEELDDLYYENEDEKYPPKRSEGPRGVIKKKNGDPEFDDGEAYYDDLGRMINPYADNQYADEEGLDDSSDGDDDLSYDSDEDDDDENAAAAVTETERGYVDTNNDGYYGGQPPPPQYDEYGNPIDYDDGNNQQYDQNQQPYDQNQQHYDQDQQQQQQYDEFGNPYPAYQQPSPNGQHDQQHEPQYYDDDQYHQHPSGDDDQQQQQQYYDQNNHPQQQQHQQQPQRRYNDDDDDRPAFA